MRFALLCSMIAALAPDGPARDKPTTTEAQPTDEALHRRALVVDTHADTTMMITYGALDITRAQPDLQVDLVKAAAGGLDAEFFSIFVLPSRYKPAEYFAEATREIDAIERLAKASPARIRVARTAAEVRTNAAAGALSALLGIEGGHSL
jgi:membrane dipeptidase